MMFGWRLCYSANQQHIDKDYIFPFSFQTFVVIEISVSCMSFVKDLTSLNFYSKRSHSHNSSRYPEIKGEGSWHAF